MQLSSQYRKKLAREAFLHGMLLIGTLHAPPPPQPPKKRHGINRIRMPINKQLDSSGRIQALSCNLVVTGKNHVPAKTPFFSSNKINLVMKSKGMNQHT